jgi:hypothetical protein
VPEIPGPYDDLTDEQRQLIAGLREDAANRAADGDRGALAHSMAHRPHDPAFELLTDNFYTVPAVHRDGCYICEDPEFAAMGLPLCTACPACVRRQETCGACKGTGGYPDKTPCSDCLATGILGGLGHIPADDDVCDDCEYEHSADDYDDEGLITGIPRGRAIAIRNKSGRRS